jgi:hypothetical protein
MEPATFFYPNLALPLFIQSPKENSGASPFVQRASYRSLCATIVAAAFCLFPTPAAAHEPKPETLAAFDHYREKTEARMDADLLASHFLYMDRFPDPRRQEIDALLRRGEYYLEQLHTLDDDHHIHVPGGIIHHWIGIAFLPRVTLAQTKSVLEDYAHEKDNYFPDVRQSRLLSQNGNASEVFLQFYSKTVVTAVFNVNFASLTTDYSPTRTQVRSCSTRVADVDNFGTPNEHELAPADSRGYLWKLCTWWHIEEKGGGTYIQVEAIELSRTVPFAFAWIVNPIIRSVPKTFLSHLLSATQKAAAKKSAAPDRDIGSSISTPPVPPAGWDRKTRTGP